MIYVQWLPHAHNAVCMSLRPNKAQTLMCLYIELLAMEPYYRCSHTPWLLNGNHITWYLKQLSNNNQFDFTLDHWRRKQLAGSNQSDFPHNHWRWTKYDVLNLSLLQCFRLWLCTFTLAVSVGAVLLLPLSIIANEVLHLYPKSYYVKWLNSSLIHGRFILNSFEIPPSSMVGLC